MADEATKSLSSKDKASNCTKKATADEERRKLTNCHDCVGDMGDTEDATTAVCKALRPLTLKAARVYKPCALVVKKTELVEGVGGTHGLRPRRKEDIVDWLVQVLYRLEYCNRGLLTYCGIVALLQKHE